MTEIAKTAADAGWRKSRYNMTALLPGSADTAIANLYSGVRDTCSPYELHVMDSLDSVSASHPLLGALAQRGFIVNFDERAALETMSRYACGDPGSVLLVICPTMGCNFDCPYCFENHQGGRMTEHVQADIVSLAERLLKVSRTGRIEVCWFGGEPLMAPDIIESLSGKLMPLAEKYGAFYDADLITNGYLLSPVIIKMLERVRVSLIQVTLDGIGAEHDMTRHPAGGGSSFERIIQNLRQPIPFKVSIRHNVHEGNRDEIEQLKAFVEDLAKETGNAIN